jgi:hypothetical protein
MDFMGEEDPERFGLLANPGGLLDEAVLSFLEEVVIAVASSQPKATPQNMGTIFMPSSAQRSNK